MLQGGIPVLPYSGYILRVQFFVNLKESAPEVMSAINIFANDLIDFFKNVRRKHKSCG